MNKRNRKVYSKDYKINAVKLVTETGRKASEVARDLGVAEQLLYLWKRQYLDKKEESFPGNGNISSKDDYIRKLELENKRLKDERDILKKAAIFFAKEP